MPFLDRIFGVLSAIFLTALPITVLILGFEPVYKMIVLLLAMIIYCVFIFFNVFKTYISLDVAKKKITIREGLKKEEWGTQYLIDINIVDDKAYPGLFYINFIFATHTKKDYGWSTGPSSRVFFGTTKTQKKRLKKFCEECNQYLQKQKE